MLEFPGPGTTAFGVAPQKLRRAAALKISLRRIVSARGWE